MAYQGYYGTSHAPYEAHNEQSTLHKMKETYWTTKQVVMRKLGKKEDDHIVASDAQLDAKLEVFKAIQKSCMDLLRAIEKYQDRLCVLSQEENSMGRFLKTSSSQDKTRAGKMMAAVGKAQSFSSQQRLALRVPLVRLYQEVETFRYRAISDTLMTINRMEGARTEYRGALLWMKDVSEELDPDTHKQLEKFRKVQAQVKKTKARFDKLKLDTMQKIDLLVASRCNMFSHVLATYQSTLLHFWAKTSRTMSAVAESFKGYQYFEFNLLKELAEPSKKLAEETSSPDEPEKGVENSTGKNGLISFDEAREAAQETENENADDANGDKVLQSEAMGVTEQDPTAPFMDLFNCDDGLDLEEVKRKQDEEFDFSGKILGSGSKEKKRTSGTTDLLSDDFEPDDTETDDLALLNEILNAPSAGGEDEFSQEWQAVFGSTLTPQTAGAGAGGDQSGIAEFLPSNLLDNTLRQRMAASQALPGAVASSTLTGGFTMPAAASSTGAAAQQSSRGPVQGKTAGGKTAGSKKNQKADMSAWFNLFADLDPLANPDAIGRNKDDVMDAL